MTSALRYFGTDGIRGRVGTEPMTEDFIRLLGRALARTLERARPMRVLIGQDTRESGPRLVRALAEGLAAEHCRVELCGVLPTPAISFLTRSRPEIDLGIVVSASHNPHYDNGIKLFDTLGGRLTEAREARIEEEIERLRSSAPAREQAPAGTIIAEDPKRYGEEYMLFCRETSPGWLHLDHWNIVLDCANGAGSDLVPDLLTRLGAHLTVIANTPNGRNINDGCGATCTEFILEKARQHHAGVGMTIDGDGDRLLMVDEKGELADGDDLLYVLACARQKADMPFGGVVGTEMTNLGLKQALQQRDIPFDSATVGDRHVMDLLCKRDWYLGGEPSGHIICRDLSPTGDALITALQVIQALTLMECTLHELRREVKKFPQITVNVACPQDWQPEETVAEATETVREELGSEGRVVVRRSGTEPLLRIMVEARTPEQAQVHAEQIAKIAKQAAARDLSGSSEST